MNHYALSDDEMRCISGLLGAGNSPDTGYDFMLYLCKLCAENLDVEKYSSHRVLYVALSSGDVRELCLKYARRGYNFKTVEYPNSALFSGQKLDFYFGDASEKLAQHFYVLLDLEQHSVVRTVESFGRDLATEPLGNCFTIPKTMARLVDEIPNNFSLMIEAVADRFEAHVTEPSL